jgi:putative membrane protein
MGWFTPTLLQNIILILKGVAMGAANKVPGVSGGIVAFVAGFYEELIDSLQKFNLKALSLLFKREWYEFYVYVNGRFLTLLFSGVIISYFSVSLILDYLIKYYEIQVLAVFFGMILASLYFVYHEIDKWKFKTILFFIIGLFIGLTIMLSKPLTENDGLFFVFFCGVISVSGMTLPGLSGSFLLLLLGNYTLLLVDSVNAIYYTLGDLIKMNLEFTNDTHRMKLLRLAVIFSLGSISGLIFFSNILSYVLKKYYQITIAIIIGFISGSLGVIWPWREKVFKLNEQGDIVNNSVGNPEIAYYDYLLPNIKTIDFWFLILFIILGAIVVTLLERYGVKKNK